jgi:hypothetical protein
MNPDPANMLTAALLCACARAQRVTQWAQRDVRELEAAAPDLAPGARAARCAAFAAVAEGIAATQHQEKFFNAPLKDGAWV